MTPPSQEETVSETVRQLLDLLPPTERRRFVWVLLASPIVAGFDALGTASVLPFMAIVVDPGALDHHPTLAVMAKAVGAGTWREAVVSAAVATGAAVALGNLAKAWGVWLQWRFEADTRHRLTSDLFRAFLRAPYSFHLKRAAPSLMRVIARDVGNVTANTLLPVSAAATSAFAVLGLLSLLAWQSPLVAAAAFATLGGAYLTIFRLARRQQTRLGELARRAEYEWTQVSHEAFGGIKDLIVLDRRERASARFADASRRLADVGVGRQAVRTFPRYVLETITLACILTVAVVLLGRDKTGAAYAIPTLTLYAFVGYRLLPGMQQLYASTVAMRYGKAALRTLHADWHETGAGVPRPAADKVEALSFRESISLHRVTFSYPGATRPALADINITIRHGESVGLVGRTGAGKSTLADLLLGLFEPDAGTVTIDGVPLTPTSADAWRLQVGYVAQHIFLANASVSHNIAFGLPAGKIDENAVREAAKLAQVDEFVATLPKGYATALGERGVRLSGGERQRVGIARALYRRPSVLIFDEATSALDGLTQEAVMEAIRRLKGERTVVLIAHRLGTLEACDRLVLLDAGRVIAMGSFAELAASSDAFNRFGKRS